MRVTALLLLLLLICGCQSGNPISPALPVNVRLSDELTVREISPGVLLVDHSYPWSANSLIVKMDAKHYIWLDTPYTPEATGLVMSWFYRTYGVDKILTEINTGFHIDNLGGNARLIQNNIPAYGSDKTCELLVSSAENSMKLTAQWLTTPEQKGYMDAYLDFKFTAPDHVFPLKKGVVLQFENAWAEVYFPGPTHTTDNVVVYISGRKLLFGGCMVKALDATSPGFIADSDMSAWPVSLAKVKARYPEARLVIPGHGAPGGPELIDHTIGLVEKANNDVQAVRE